VKAKAPDILPSSKKIRKGRILRFILITVFKSGGKGNKVNPVFSSNKQCSFFGKGTAAILRSIK
jgi:hypothetical protein